MAIKMLLFDYRDTEKPFFENNDTMDSFDITYICDPLNEETVNNLTDEQKENTQVVSVFIDSDVTENVINQFRNLRVISTRSTGYDHISKKASINKNIAVVNVENYGATAVAEYTIGLIIALTRNIIPANLFIKNLQKTYSTFVGRDLKHLTIGVVGTGSIGASVCKLGKAFGSRIIAYDKKEKQELAEKYGVEYVSFEELIKQSDVITLHLPYTGDNYHMFGEHEFSLMKENSYFVNTSRGELIDINKLYKVIAEKKIKGAALDVVACESLSFHCDDLVNNLDKLPLDCLQENYVVQKLAEFPNVIITPHIAYDTQDAIDYILEKTFEGIKDYLSGGHDFKVI